MKLITTMVAGFAFALCASTTFAAETATTTPPKGDMHHGPMGGEGKMPPHFMKSDTDHDGAISKAEWTAQGEKMFKEMDTNGDGKITGDEMKAHHAAKVKERSDRREEWKAKMDAEKKTDAPVKH